MIVYYLVSYRIRRLLFFPCRLDIYIMTLATRYVSLAYGMYNVSRCRLMATPVSEDMVRSIVSYDEVPVRSMFHLSRSVRHGWLEISSSCRFVSQPGLRSAACSEVAVRSMADMIIGAADCSHGRHRLCPSRPFVPPCDVSPMTG